MRQIDADALIDELSLVYDIAEDKDDPYNIGVMAAIATIKRMPTIDAVPVADHYEILLAEKAKSWRDGLAAGIKVERQHHEAVEELERNGYIEDERREE